MLWVVAIVVIVARFLFAVSRNGSDKDTQAARAVADRYIAFVKSCNLDSAKQLRKYGISDKDEVSILCAKGCKSLNFTYSKIYEKLKTEVVPGDPEQAPIKSAAFQYKMTCGDEQKPYMMGMEYNNEAKKWQVFLDTSIGNPAAL